MVRACLARSRPSQVRGSIEHTRVSDMARPELGPLLTPSSARQARSCSVARGTIPRLSSRVGATSPHRATAEDRHGRFPAAALGRGRGRRLRSSSDGRSPHTGIAWSRSATAAHPRESWIPVAIAAPVRPDPNFLRPGWSALKSPALAGFSRPGLRVQLRNVARNRSPERRFSPRIGGWPI